MHSYVCLSVWMSKVSGGELSCHTTTCDLVFQPWGPSSNFHHKGRDLARLLRASSEDCARAWRARRFVGIQVVSRQRWLPIGGGLWIHISFFCFFPSSEAVHTEKEARHELRNKRNYIKF